MIAAAPPASASFRCSRARTWQFLWSSFLHSGQILMECTIHTISASSILQSSQISDIVSPSVEQRNVSRAPFESQRVGAVLSVGPRALSNGLRYLRVAQATVQLCPRLPHVRYTRC